MAEVAALAGVSTSTVSRHMNGLRVKPDAALRVQSAASRLGYQPNRVARALRVGHAGVIGLVVPDVRNQWFASLVKAIEDTCRAHGLSVVICNSDYDPDRERDHVEVLRARQVDALFLVSSQGAVSRDLLRHLADGWPVVAFDGSYVAPGVDVVVSDNASGMRELATHMVGHGYRRFVLVTGPPTLAATTDRQAAATSIILQSGGTVEVIPGNLTFDAGVQALSTLVSSGHRLPEAVIAVNDEVALGVMQAAIRRGIKLPSDLAVAGFDDVLVSSWATVALTTVYQDVVGLAESAVGRFLSRLADRGQPASRSIVPARLVIRESCGCR
jgi:LacI family transcriptional regulator